MSATEVPEIVQLVFNTELLEISSMSEVCFVASLQHTKGFWAAKKSLRSGPPTGAKKGKWSIFGEYVFYHLSVTDIPVSVTDSCWLSQKSFACLKTGCVGPKQYVLVPDSLCPSPTVCVCPDSLYVTDSLCLPQIVSFCHRKIYFVILCLYETPFLIIFGLIVMYFCMIFI